MALLTPLNLDEARELARAFGVELATFEALSLGSVNSNFRATTRDGRVLFARLYEEQGPTGAEAELELLRALERAGTKVARALPCAGALPLHRGKPFAAFDWVDGEILCSGRVTPAVSRRVGAALARFHLATPLLPRLGPGRFGPAAMLERLARVEREAERPALLSEVARVRELYGLYAPARDPELPSGVVHGDLFRDNVLWQGDSIAALLDFESAFHGPFVYDLMVTVAAWCYGDTFDLGLVTALVEGYTSARPLTSAERRAVPVEGALACLRFATSRITDFELRTREGERPARDFRRFLARLSAIVDGRLSPVLG
ncbi:MAG TPA: homoserine kinase [Polyangiaceae bacterium]|nr:homoserine kinase [Polyangiaceae bacterium]